MCFARHLAYDCARRGMISKGSDVMRVTLMTMAGAAVLATAPVPAAASNKDWDHASSIGRDLLVGAALGVPAVQSDWRGLLQAGGSIGASGLTAAGLKEVFPELRPDGSDRKSFPSGHTAVSFAAAATLQNRYGWKVG